MEYAVYKHYPQGIEECDVPAGYTDSVITLRGSLDKVLSTVHELYGHEVAGGPEPVEILVLREDTGETISTIRG